MTTTADARLTHHRPDTVNEISTDLGMGFSNLWQEKARKKVASAEGHAR